MPFLIALVRWERKEFQCMAVGILEIEGANARGSFVPLRYGLWARRRELNSVLPKPCICLVHIANDDGDMLKPQIIASRIGGDRPSSWRKILSQFQLLVA